MQIHLVGMKRLRGLRGQVLLWMLLPLMILLILFSLTGLQSHQEVMHALAIEETSRMVRILAQAISLQLEIAAQRSQTTLDQFPVADLNLENLLGDVLLNSATTVILVNERGDLLLTKGPISVTDDVLDWPGVQGAFDGSSGASFILPTESDLIGYAPVAGTDWALVLREPWHTLNVPLIRFEQTMPFIASITILISGLALVFGLRLIVQPLRALEQRAFQVGQGNYDAASTSVGGVTEIEDLRRAIHAMAQQIRQNRDALQAYLGAITEAQEGERTRIARELHDDTVQQLIALDHRAQRIQRTLSHDPDQAAERVTELRQMIDKAIHDVRRMCRALRPASLDELGLAAALETLALEANATFRAVGSAYRLSEAQEAALYRIAQEALNNALQHAQAKQIRVELRFDQAGVTLVVYDDGVGFEFLQDFDNLARRRHFGLLGMRERAQLIGGKLQIQSVPGSGTTVTVTIA
ncbi:MAG: sensor histidine kinase [Anaerolineae bacterium]|nr:sensor histidine kinase [Anaerolineae bacterium]